MKKNKDTKREEKVSDPATSLPEDKPDKVEVAPAVADVKSESSVLKRGIAMEKIDSPRYGVPGQASATRGAAGGGAINPSGQVGRSPNNPEIRGAGSDPMNKLDIRDELAWNDIGAIQYRTVVEGSAAGFQPDAILGNFTYADNLAFQFDNTGERPGVKNRPYRRRVRMIGKDQNVFIAGQHDSASKAGMRFYPTKTYDRAGNRSQVNVQGVGVAVSGQYPPMERSNYLMRGMRVDIGYSAGAFRITGVQFDTVELPCKSSPDDLDVRYDNARVTWDVADRDITENYFSLVNEAANLQANKYSPLPDGQPDAVQHLILARDICNTDAAIALLAIRSAMETYALNRALRPEYGSGDGARAQARSMLGERIAQNVVLESGLWADNAAMAGIPDIEPDMGNADTVGAHRQDFMRLSMPEYIQTYLDSPSKYNDGFGVWVTQPRGLRLLFEEAQRSFDDGGFLIDKDTYAIVNKIFGWHEMDGRLAGVSRVGIITPVDYNELYEHVNTTGQDAHPTEVIAIDANSEIHSKYTMVDYVLNGSFYNHTELRSPLVDAILQVFKYRIMPKLSNESNTYEFYVPFDFACDHYSFGHAILMEAMAYIHQFTHPAKAVFERFEQQYGVNPLCSDQMQELKLADVVAGSGYKGIGADPTFPESSEALRLLFYLPEVYQMGVQCWDGGLEAPDALVAIKFTDLAPLSDDISQNQRVLFPMLYQTETMGQWRKIKDMGPEKLLCSRDFPIHRYALGGEGYTRKDTLAVANVPVDMPFFGVQKPQVYHTENSASAELGLTIKDVLCAPRYSGRIAPAPLGMLDFVRLAGAKSVHDVTVPMSASDMQCGCFWDLMLCNNNNYDSTYGWMACPDDDIISISSDSGIIYVDERDIENYHVSFVYMPPYAMDTLGCMLRRYFVHFGSGCLGQAALACLQDTYGIWVSSDQQSTELVDVSAIVTDKSEEFELETGSNTNVSLTFSYLKVGDDTYTLDPNGGTTTIPYIGGASGISGVSVELVDLSPLPYKRWKVTNASGSTLSGDLLGKTHTLALKYENDAMKMWTNDNILEFIFSPFTGNVHAELSNNGGECVTVDHDITLPLMFGFLGYQELFYDRLNVANYASKQAVGGRIYDDAMLRKSNLFFE